VGWSVKDPRVFLERLGGDASAAEQKLEGLLRDAKNSVVGQHPLGDFISTNEKDLKFDLIEKEMLTAIQAKAADASYGLEISLLGIKQLGLPESITTKVFDRMKAEREQLAAQFKGEAAAEDLRIRSEANRQRDSLLADAERQATIIKGQADAAVADQLKTFETNPELAVFLLKLNAVESSLKERSTLVLDPRTPPFDLLRGQPELPETKKPSNR
jgi:membrane protease subunit HflC